MHNSQEAINPHLLLHTKAGPEPPDNHSYFHIGQPQQHMLGQTPYIHYAQQPSLSPPSQAHNVYGTGRESIEARYRALMRNMLMYQQMRIRATNTTYTEPQRQQQQQQQEDEASLFSSFSLPQHHPGFEYNVLSSFNLPPPAAPTIRDTAAPEAHVEVAAPTTTITTQDLYQFGYSNDSSSNNETTTDHRQQQRQKPNRGSGALPKPTPRPKDDGRVTAGARPSPSRVSRSKPKSKARPIAGAVRFALLEELAHRQADTARQPLSSSSAADRGQDDRDGDDDAELDLDGMDFTGVSGGGGGGGSGSGGDTSDLVLECFVSGMSSGLG